MATHGKTRKSFSATGVSEDRPIFSTMPDAGAAPGFNLANHFLIAMPSMLDPVFGGTVVYLCEHNAQGALGVIINKPTDMSMDLLFDKIDLELEITLQPGAHPVMFGGPVQVERGFVLHSPHDTYSSTMPVTEAIALTTSKDILEAAAAGKGPDKILVSLGCSGWSAGQLEEEIARNGWLTVPADPAIVFDLPIEQRFVAAMKLLGIDPVMLAGVAGHA
ncbi:YqgE/AlgH family protein [Janthinobacterium sp. 17J80-10]|nr:YqgE/AlgH family protein [Janthinobacterium sp. 17J80-10]